MLFIFEWIGTIFGIAGAMLVASNTRHSSWGWWLFLVSSLSLCLYAVMQSAWGLFVLNAFFVTTNITGLVRWWWPHVNKPQAVSG